jgi:hypothetical protein
LFESCQLPVAVMLFSPGRNTSDNLLLQSQYKPQEIFFSTLGRSKSLPNKKVKERQLRCIKN